MMPWTAVEPLPLGVNVEKIYLDAFMPTLCIWQPPQWPAANTFGIFVLGDRLLRLYTKLKLEDQGEQNGVNHHHGFDPRIRLTLRLSGPWHPLLSARGKSRLPWQRAGRVRP